MELVQFPTTDALASAVADLVEDTLARNPRAVFGWPSGRTTVPVLREFAHRGTVMSQATIAMMDDYVLGAPGRWGPVDPTAHYSCGNWVTQKLVRAFAREAAPTVINPDVSDPGRYDKQLADLGGVDVFLVGLGSSDGHVAFNPPGTQLDTRTRVIPLADSTRRDNLGTFPAFNDLAEVPTAGLTVGLATICRAQQVLALAHGPGKADVVRRTLAHDQFDPALPSTFLYTHPFARLFVADLGVEL